ncbi:MAG: Ig-like domain-containing protein, partial [Firmicutes bacterium]|nr:Ig-like domain-containing protein [Bacillota bacterium]
FTMMPIMGAPVYADDTAPAAPGIALGSDVLSVGSNTSGAATVHMADKTWRVIGYDGSGVAGSASTMTLLSAGILKKDVVFREYIRDEGSDSWYHQSVLQSEVEAIANTFSAGEKAGIATRNLKAGDYNGYDTDTVSRYSVSNARLWPLSTKEAHYTLNGDIRNVNDFWWLRSPGHTAPPYFTCHISYIKSDGNVDEEGCLVTEKNGVRPAFNYKLNSVIFTSAATGGKSSGTVGADSLKVVGTNANNEWKVTVKNGHDNFAVSSVTTCDGKTLNINYSGAITGKNEYISAIIKDKAGKVKYYGNLKNCASGSDASGTVKINVEGKLGAEDKLYIFNEQLNGDKKTDFASELKEVADSQALPTGHDWSAPTYKWEKDDSSVTASRVCVRDSSHKETETVATVKTTKDATCKEKGKVTRTATFKNKAFKSQTKTIELPVQPNNHDWDNGEEVQGQNICGGKGMLYTCKICKATKVEGSGPHTWETKYTVFTTPTCTEAGDEFYKCSKCDKLDLERPHVLPPLGHDWSAPTYKWAGDNSSVTASRLCGHDSSHNEAETVKTVKTTKNATYTKNGEITYKATFNNGAFVTQTKTVTIPKLKPSAPKVSGILLMKMTAKGKTSFVISWNKIKGAAGYDIFFARCNHSKKKNVPKKVKTIKGNKTFKWTKKKLKKSAEHKAYVKAFVYKNGKKTYVRTSPLMHSYTGNGTKKYTNAKSVKVNKTKVTLKKGKTFKIKAKVKKVKKSKKLLPKKHSATLRYITSNKKIATVSKSGKIKAKTKGTCNVYVFAHNGVSKKIKVTVK